MKEYNQDKNELINRFHTDLNNGLNDHQVAENKACYGQNKLKEAPKKTSFQKFLEQFKDIMIIILLIAAGVSFIVAFSQDDSAAFFEPVLILLIVILNAFMGVVQENKAEKAMEALKSMSSLHARVIRQGKEEMIEASDLVVGDLIVLQDGDYVPADARLIESSMLKVEESPLTGESVPIDKNSDVIVDEDAPLAERLNMVYSGCSVTYGSGKAIVTAVGMNSEMGKIAGLLENAEEVKTPLQIKLAQLGKYLGVLALIVCLIIFVMGIIDGMDILEIFMTSISLAVSAIPEGLPVIVTIVLSIGVGRMAKRNAIVKKLSAVETLGSTSVICSDKTGTLTQNKMTLMQIYSDRSKEIKAVKDVKDGADLQVILLGTLCSDGNVEIENGIEKHLGDPTETCIVLSAMQKGYTKKDLNDLYPRLYELPFDSKRKLMSSVNRIHDKTYVIVKGAFDQLMERCVSGDLKRANEMMIKMSEKALRVIGVAIKEVDFDHLPSKESETLEQGLTFVGLLGMIDPPREEVKDAVALCQKAGIRPVMITGDHVVTAKAIAKDLGIYKEGDLAVTGLELQSMSNSEFEEKIKKISVYARVTPQDKIRVVNAWQRQDKIVAMTGDGVNDAPALKAADIGCAMGITGTDVAKGAADLTLMDDNFTTIVEAVREGRGIYNNIRKTVGFLLGTNIGEVLIVFLSMLFWKQAPLLSMQLLWINLVTDSLPAIALGMEPIEDDVMNEKPRAKDEGIFARGLGVQVVLQGFMFGCLALFAFRYGWQMTGRIESGRTMAFLVLALSQIIHSLNMRSHKSIFKMGFFKNKRLIQAIFISLLLISLVLFIPPVTYAFGLESLSVSMYLVGIIISCIPVVALEIAKAFHLIHI